MDENYKHAKAFRDGTQRAAHDAEVALRREQERLANSGKLYPIKSIENGHEVTRYEGDIAAYFGPFMGVSHKIRVVNPRRGGNR